MALSRKKLSILFSIYIVFHIGSTEGIRTRSYSHNFGHEGFLQDQSSFTSPGQVFGYCNETNVTEHRNKIKLFCTFAVETTEALYSPEHLRICDFSLSSNATNKNESYLLKEVSAISQYKAVLKLEGTQSSILFMLNFTNCKARKAKLDMGMTNFKIYAVSEHKFDVLFLDSEVCPGRLCRIILDTEGNILSEAHPWIEDKSDIVNVVDSPIAGRFVIDEYKNESQTRWTRIYTTGNNDSVEIKKEYLVEERAPNATYGQIVTSMTYKLVSVCIELDMNLTCIQFDLAGNRKFEIMLILNKVAQIHSLDIHNLSRGGFLLLIDGCSRNYRGICLFKDRIFIIEQLDNMGQFIGSLKIERGFRAYLDYTHIFESKRNELCLSNVHNPRDDSGKVTLDIVCLQDDDFYVKIPWPNTIYP